MNTRTSAIVGITMIGLFVSAAPALANSTPSKPGVVIAQDTQAAITAKQSGPTQITVSTAPNIRVSMLAKTPAGMPGRQPMNKVTDGTGLAVFTSLNPGMTYEVLTQSAMTSVTVLRRVGEARALTVTTTDEPDAVRLAWTYAAPKGSGDKPQFRVEARPGDASQPVIVDQVTGTATTLSGLNPSIRYTLRVTPFNVLGDGAATSARMNRSLLEITGRTVAIDPAPVAPVVGPTRVPDQAPTTPPSVEPQPAPATAPPSAPSPSLPRTKTIFVCPEGYSESGSTCRKTSPYTYATKAYTYTYGKTGTETFIDTCASGYTDSSGQFHWVEQPHPCQRSRDVFGNIKDATPPGWTDTGSNWSKKDDALAGWSDDGSQYVQMTDKIAQEVPA